MPHPNPIQIQKFLKGVDYPASRQDLLDKAKDLGADENVYSSLEQLPDDQFQTPAEVSQAIGRLPDDTSSQTASGDSKGSGGSGDHEFLAQAAQDSLGKIELCELALEKSSRPDITQFAQQMIDEHGQLGQKIEQLCKSKNIELPDDASEEHEALVQEMSELSGDEFDRRFIEQNVKDHEKDIKVFRHYAEESDDADIKALAKQAVQMLSGHLDMAKRLAG